MIHRAEFIQEDMNSLTLLFLAISSYKYNRLHDALQEGQPEKEVAF